MSEQNKKFKSIKELMTNILDEKNKKPKKKTEEEIFEKKKKRILKNINSINTNFF